MTTPNLQDRVKTVLRGKLIAIQAYLKKQEKHQIINLSLHFSNQKKNNQTHTNTRTHTHRNKPKVNKEKEIIKNRAEIRDKQMKETSETNKAISWLFEKMNKIDKPLASHIKKIKNSNQ